MIQWRLRMAAAERGVWTATDLRRLLADEADYPLSAPSVGALLTGEPSQVRLSTLLALCTALRCTPNDLFDLETDPAPAAGAHQSAGSQLARRSSMPRSERPRTTGRMPVRA
jgi:DNA-binding Xre family transcriptional regulator